MDGKQRNKRQRAAAAAAVLGLCVGLSGCGTGLSGSTPGDIADSPAPQLTIRPAPGGEASPRPTPEHTAAPSAAPTASSTPDAGGGAVKAELYIAEVTAVNDDGTLALTLCQLRPGREGDVSDPAGIDMSAYTPGGSQLNYRIPEDAQVQTAHSGQLSSAKAADAAAGDRLLIYSGEGGGTHVVIYPGGQDGKSR